MTTLLSSKFETYLLDEELEIERGEQRDEQAQHLYYEQYPEGFFTSL